MCFASVLPTGRTADVELRVRPSPSVDTFRAEFRVTYDDRERAGKTELFADRVRLVAPPTVFRPISNPYATGRPLRGGSPVFFGREDFTERLIDAVETQPLVAVIVGSSGSGKSSAVFAGLIPQLREKVGWSIAQSR